MTYISVSDVAKKWGTSERSVRNYCTNGRVIGAYLEGKTWKIPSDAEKPLRKRRTETRKRTLLQVLKDERESGLNGGIYHKIQIELTYNSNHIEGSMLTHDQTRHIFETSTIGVEDKDLNVDDIIETVNHFRCIDLIIDHANHMLTEALIKQLHCILKSGTSDSRKTWFAVGDYKRLENEVGGMGTTLPDDVPQQMKRLVKSYNSSKERSLKDIIDFHYKFERIHPFQDGNGRIGRLIMFKECLHHGIVPFIIEDDLREFYYRGLNEWKREKGYLMDTCLLAQDRFRVYLDYFKISC